MKIKPSIAILVMPVVMITGCSDWDDSKTFEFPDFDFTIKTDPKPLEVGEDAQISVLLMDGEHAAMPGCSIRFRQFMPGMEMDTDNKYLDMKEIKKGVYRGRSGEFSMGGDWVIEFDVKCQNNSHTVPIPYHLEWPE